MVEETAPSKVGDQRRAAILEALRQRQKQGAVEKAAIPRRESPDQPAPLSFAQERLWFLEQLEDLGTTNHVSRVTRLLGRVEPDALSRALRRLCNRHEALRTGFVLTDGVPRQIVSDAVELDYSFLDVSGDAKETRGAAVHEIVASVLARTFDLSSPGLIRACLVRVGDEEHVLVLVIHHLVTDGWSMGVFNRELAALYQSESTGTSVELPALPVQMADYSAWQRSTLTGEVLDGMMAYWRSVLGELPEPLDLPTDFPRAADAHHEGGVAVLEIGADELEAMRGLCRETRCTFSMGLLAVFKLLMARYAGREDVAVGTAVANRDYPELEHMIGFLINTVVLRTDLSGAPSFRELIGRVRETALGAYSHQSMPFEKLVEELNPPRDASRNPIFQVFFNHYTVMRDEDSRIGDARVVPFELGRGGSNSKFDLTLYLSESRDKVHLRLVYRADLFRRERMQEMLLQFRHLLREAAGAPDSPITDLSLLTPEARKRLPDPAEPIPVPQQTPVMALVAHWAEQTPDRIAIKQGGRQWRYAELHARARGVATELRAAGVARGEVVAIEGPRTFGLIASMLGVLRHGGVMLPVDPELPAERRALMLRLSGACSLIRVVADDAAEQRSECDEFTLPIIEVDAHAVPDVGGAKSPDEMLGVSGGDAAYMFFTSGTTGTPKAVLGSHRGLSHFVQWQGRQFGIGPTDRAAQLIALSFDAVLRDVFTPLAHGARLCLAENPGRLDAAAFWGWLHDEEITMLNTVPSLAQMWLAHGRTDMSIPSMRWSFFSGEPLTGALVRKWRLLCPNASVVNFYGPTETTMIKSFHVVADEPDDGVQPSGLPLPETQALVLSSSGRLCGIAERGEIAIRTPFRTLGYVGADPEESDRFQPNPFVNDDSDILFHTGDLGRYAPDGSLELLGRQDDQVKIRGVRVELGEVSDALARFADVDACHVDVTKDAQEQSHLVAYVVLRESARTSTERLRTDLDRILPPAMVPSVFMSLEQLPLGATGKIDRDRLPKVNLDHLDRAAEFEPPKGDTESRLASIWCDVLHLEKVSVLDSFFALGGHSMLAIELFARIEREFERSLPLSVLYHAGTVRELATEIGSKPGPRGWSSIVEIQPNGNRRPLFLVHGVAGNVIFFRGLADRLSADQPVFAFQPETVDGRLPAARTFEELASQYIAEMKQAQPRGPYRLGGFSYGGLLAYEMTRQLLAAGEEVDILLVFDTRGRGALDAETRARDSQRPRRRVRSAVHSPLRRRTVNTVRGVARRTARSAKKRWNWVRTSAKITLMQLFTRRVPVDARPDFTFKYCVALRKDYRMKPCQARAVYFSTQHRREAAVLDYWRRAALGGLRVHRVVGKHKEGLFNEPNVSEVARIVEGYLTNSNVVQSEDDAEAPARSKNGARSVSATAG